MAMVKHTTEEGLPAAQASNAQGVTALTARTWLGRDLAGVEAALADASSHPTHSPRAIDASKALLIIELRRRRMTAMGVARSVGVSGTSAGRVPGHAGLSKLRDWVAAVPVAHVRP